MKRHEFLILIAAITIALAISIAGCESKLAKNNVAKQQRPNIILLLTDDQRWDTMGCAGNKIIQTPNMDDMATNGVRFANAFVTTSMCASSRASILTGQWTGRHGITDIDKHLSEDAMAQTYPLLLKQSGYRTGFVGMYGMGTEGDLPVDKFDFWRGFAGQGKYENKDSTGKNKHLTQIIGEQTIEFLQDCSAEKPFCLSVSFKAPQCQDDDPRQFIYDPVYKDLYKDVTIPDLETTARDYYEALPEFLKQSQGRILWQKRFLTLDMFQESKKNYYRLITGVDTVIGKIREQLVQLGLDDNTIIILTSDNGFYLGEYGLAGKWLPHDVSIRVPLIILDPRTDSTLHGITVEQMALNVDIAPTIIELTGLEVPGQMQGQSLLPFLQGRQTRWRTEFYYENLYEHELIPRTVAVRTEDFKYIRYIDHNYEELYELKNDPNEAANLSIDSKYQRTLTSLQKQRDVLSRQVEGM